MAHSPASVPAHFPPVPQAPGRLLIQRRASATTQKHGNINASNGAIGGAGHSNNTRIEDLIRRRARMPAKGVVNHLTVDEPVRLVASANQAEDTRGNVPPV
ncbi:hypothetical protein CSOJ01_09560 [Colletotrichum sojae]|uniref:Uncharacterized protein n=1 Tax=Colletotrichum sojae TaxID=2175907 RepID=A0A8H6J2N2_9PEZI|nr:hypothetical protein CSOJ01_09560 [Colletotrichum sojae]